MNDLQTTPDDTELDTVAGKIDLTEAFRLRYKHCLSYQQIADRFGVSKQAVHQRLSAISELLPNSEEIENYRQNKQKMLEGAELKILNKILDSETIKDASLNNAAYAFNTIYQSNRLESGKSTSNINVVEVTGTIQDLQTQAQRLRDSL